MSVHVTGTILSPEVTEPATPFAYATVLNAGETTVITVGPYTNASAVSQDLGAITVTNPVGVTVNSVSYTSTPSDVPTVMLTPGLTASVDINVTANVEAPGTSEFSFDVDVAVSPTPEAAVNTPLEQPAA